MEFFQLSEGVCLGQAHLSLSEIEIYKKNTFINTKKAKVSKHVELEKNLRAQAEVGEVSTKPPPIYPDPSLDP